MRVVVLGCGTGVGKTRVSAALLRALTSRGLMSLGLKPIESGVDGIPSPGRPPLGSDAATLADAGSVRPTLLHPLYGLAAPVSPHLAARAAGLQIELERAVAWTRQAEHSVTAHATSHIALWTVIETAGGVFSPLGPGISNFDLALALEPASWVLVASDSLGVLHEVSATLKAMQASGRRPDHVVLSGAREPDQSSGSNAAELATLGIVAPSAVLARGDDSGILSLLNQLIADDARRAKG